MKKLLTAVMAVCAVTLLPQLALGQQQEIIKTDTAHFKPRFNHRVIERGAEDGLVVPQKEILAKMLREKSVAEHTALALLLEQYPQLLKMAKNDLNIHKLLLDSDFVSLALRDAALVEHLQKEPFLAEVLLKAKQADPELFVKWLEEIEKNDTLNPESEQTPKSVRHE